MQMEKLKQVFHSSVGQSVRLLTARSTVQARLGEFLFVFFWKGRKKEGICIACEKDKDIAAQICMQEMEMGAIA